ncbi:MAG TPA: SDR family NAD(P)-dependent oxidoreductase [Gemmatimonadaceae bacterium]|nr:SDR family NAD(P)-dependent oxidoreductase [Gemmatimonadaceae bacterium]
MKRTAVITGGTRGLGRALVRAFAERGYRVHATGTDQRALHALQRESARAGHEVVPLRGDVSSVEDNAALARRIEGEGSAVDVLVHNAGLLGAAATSLAEYPPDVFARVMAVNVFGPFDLTRQLVPLLAPNAAIEFVTSGVSVGPRTGWGAYNVSKIALDGLAGIWARELRDRGVRVYIIDPRPMRTAMRASAYPDEDPATLPTPEEHVAGYVRLAEADEGSPSGERFRADAL